MDFEATLTLYRNWLIKWEGSTLVEEPISVNGNKRWSKFGILGSNRNEVAKYSERDFDRVLREHIVKVTALKKARSNDNMDFGTFIIILDFHWTSGKGHRVLDLWAVDPEGVQWFQFIRDYYISLGRKTKYRPYVKGWLLRLRSLLDVLERAGMQSADLSLDADFYIVKMARSDPRMLESIDYQKLQAQLHA